MIKLIIIAIVILVCWLIYKYWKKPTDLYLEGVNMMTSDYLTTIKTDVQTKMDSLESTVKTDVKTVEGDVNKVV